MEQFSLRNLVNKYIDDEKKRNKNMRSKSAIYKWIIDDVRDILVAINDDFREINNDDTNAKKKFRAKIIGEFETKYFKKFLKNKSETADYYDKLLNDCLIHIETIEDFLNPENDSKQNPKTLDFFRAFCKYQEREYGQETSTSITRQKHQISNDVKIETLQISGAIIINEEFIDNIKKQEFSMAEFYTAKQNEDCHCQWYGITQLWDVERTDYRKVSSVVEQCFETERHNKVVAIIYGDGGSGKSTLQRRLAVDLSSSEKFKVLWLYNFEDFLNGNKLNNTPSGLEIIKNDVLTKYIIFIEDWYSLVDYNGESDSKKFLKQTQSTNNIRIVIGDRVIQGKHYLDYLYDDNNKFLLRPSENKFILGKVVEKFKELEVVIDEDLFDKLGEAPLFLHLYIIAKSSEENKLLEIDLSEPHKAFQNIIKNNLQQLINLRCSGMAKALHYWSCIYSEFRINISFKTLLELAKHFNRKKDRNPKEYENLKLNSQITRIINTFIRVSTYNEMYEYNPFYFNHDALSDNGLSKISFSGWDTYDEVLLKSILNILILDKYINISTCYLEKIIEHKPHLLNNQEKLYYINLLIDKRINGQYINLLCTIDLDRNEVINSAKKILYNGLNSFSFWRYYSLLIMESKFINRNIIKIISLPNPAAIASILRFCVDEKTFEKMLNYNGWKRISPLIVRCLKTSINPINKTLENQFINQLLNLDDFKKISPSVINYCMSSCEIQEKNIIAKKILNYSNWKTLNAGVICECLNYVNENTKKDFSYKLLSDNNWSEIDTIITAKCLSISKDREFALSILCNWKTYDKILICSCLQCFEGEQKIPLKVQEIIQEIICNFRELSPPNTSSKEYYLILLKINFSSLSIWKEETEYIIKNWRKLNRIFITNVLQGYVKEPNMIKKICSNLLKNWNEEIRQNTSASLTFKFGEHVEFALGHPELRKLAKEIALEINKVSNQIREPKNIFIISEGLLGEENPIPKNIAEIVTNILEKDIYPEWKI